jgi:GTPase SAR1 family protein
MKIIHLEGFTDEELVTLYRPAVVENIVQLFQGLVGCVKNKSERLLDQNVAFGDSLLSSEVILYNDFADKYHQLLNLWKDPKIQETANDPDAKLSLVLLDSAHYWYKHIDRILSDDYKPTVKDIIKSRTKTTGIQDIVFEIDGYKFKLTDVGGQRSERKKWISCFQNLTAILFVVALSEYDQTLSEDVSTNRMTESIKLFRGVVGNDALHHVAMVLFLNKEDLFSEKIQRSDLSKSFPEYTGDPQDKEQAFEFIKNQFISLNTNPNRKIYSQVTVATDIDNIRAAMDIVKDIVIGHALNAGKAM